MAMLTLACSVHTDATSERKGCERTSCLGFFSLFLLTFNEAGTSIVDQHDRPGVCLFEFFFFISRIIDSDNSTEIGAIFSLVSPPKGGDKY